QLGAVRGRGVRRADRARSPGGEGRPVVSAPQESASSAEALARTRADITPMILDLFGALMLEAAEQLMAATPGAANPAGAGRIRGADFRDLLSELSGLPRPLVGALTGEGSQP